MISEKNNLQTAQEWTKSYIELIASHVHPKTGNHLRSHLRAIMALDHRRLIRPGKKSGRIFCVRQVNFAKSCQQIWVRVNQPFIHLRWNSTMRHCFYHTDLGQQNAVFDSFAIQSALIKDDGSKRGLWAKPLTKFPKSSIRPSGSHFCSASCGECLNEH